MEITPASLTQVFKGRGGRFITVDGEVARQLQAIDPELHLRYSHGGDYFVVYRVDGGTGVEELVLTAQQCDLRIVNRVRTIAQPTYDYGAELDRIDAERNKQIDYEKAQEVGEIGERLAHAIRKDIGATNRAFITKEIPDA